MPQQISILPRQTEKIKFCCGNDIVNDLNEIINLSSGKQLLAALDHINRVIEKTGPRDCLLTLKTHFLIKMGEMDQAHETNEQFVAKNPGNSIGHQHRATLFCSKGDTAKAVESLQDALDRLPGDEVPISLSNGFRLVGLALLNSAQVFAARAHLRYALQLRGESDSDDINRYILESYRMPWGSLLLKEDLRLIEPPEGAEWLDDYSTAVRLSRQGQWRQAVDKLNAIDQKHPDQVAVINARGAMHACLGNNDQFVEDLRLVAAHADTELPVAIESEVIAQFFDQEPASGTFDVVRVSFEVDDPKSLQAEWVLNKRLVDLGGVQMREEDGPPPIGAFAMLDRDELSADQIEASDSLQIGDIPVVQSNLMIFGKETDREARVETFLVRDSHFESSVAAIKDLLADKIQGEPVEENVDEVLIADRAMNWDWHLPPEIPIARRRELLTGKVRETILKRWVEIPFRVLGAKTASEVIGNQEYQVRLAALALRLDAILENQPGSDAIYAELISKLQLPLEESIDPTEKDPFQVSAIRHKSLIFEKLTDDQVESLFTHGLMIGNFPALRLLIPEMLKREHLAERVSFPQALTVLARITVDNDEAFEHLKTARQLATNAGEPVGSLLVLELDLRMERGISDKCETLMREIQSRHMHEPDVEMFLVQTLARHGLIRPDGRPVDEPDQTVESAADAGGVWTPDSDSGSASSGESKLWLPD